MRVELKIKGMHCKSCSELIEDKLADKVNSIKVDFEKGFAFIDFDEQKISELEIKKIIQRMGYEI